MLVIGKLDMSLVDIPRMLVVLSSREDDLFFICNYHNSVAEDRPYVRGSD